MLGLTRNEIALLVIIAGFVLSIVTMYVYVACDIRRRSSHDLKLED